MSKRGDETSKRLKVLAEKLEAKKAASPESAQFLSEILNIIYDLNLRVHAMEMQDGPSDAFVGIDGPTKIG